MTAQDKRAAALGLVGECTTSLPTLTEASQVRDLGQELLARAHQFQVAPEDQPYFTRTVSRLAHEVRSHGWVDIVLEILEWGMAHGAVDGHVLSEVAECQLSRNDVADAEQTLERASALVAGFADVMCYVVIITASHQMGRHREAKRVVTAAQHDGRPQKGTLAA